MKKTMIALGIILSFVSLDTKAVADESKAEYFAKENAHWSGSQASGKAPKSSRHRRGEKYEEAGSLSLSQRGAALLAEAQKWIGSKNPTGFRGPWCGAFQAMVARNVGVEPPSGYLQARQWVHAGRRIHNPEVGSIAVLSRGRRGGHVGVVAGVDGNGNPVIVSGNHNRRVGVAAYPSSRVLAYVAI